jgi:hypothetical protein
MIDYSNISNSLKYNQIYYNQNGSWETWNKPANIKFVYVFAIGGGGGGGGGRTSAINSACGGGGGGSSSITIGLFPANLLPDTLYIQVGAGGVGGSPNVNGTNGALSYVSFYPNSSLDINNLIASGGVGATGGAFGSSSVGGVGGSGGTAYSFTTTIFGEIGQVTSAIGQNGTSGGNLGGGTPNLTPTFPLTGGAGGGAVSAGGTTYTAGSIIGSGFLSTVSGGIADSATSTINGSSGYQNLTYINNILTEPMFFTGGAGGASATTNPRAGGNGGNGAFGSGGAGGGGAYSGIGGTGGKGGDGLIIITCW